MRYCNRKGINRNGVNRNGSWKLYLRLGFWFWAGLFAFFGGFIAILFGFGFSFPWSYNGGFLPVNGNLLKK